MNVHLVDGTYELFRHHFALPSWRTDDGQERGALRGVLRSMLGMLEDGATHVAVATDHVVESFRNRLWSGYKTGEGIDPELEAQFHPMEEALRAMGVVVWAMEDFEADDALAAGAAVAARDDRVGRVFVCTPDKDLAQCVRDRRVVQLDRRKREIRDRDGVVAKFGVEPASIPDYLALVGDTADGFPGVPGWGAKSAATLLARYEHLDHIPEDPDLWDVKVRGRARLATALAEHREDARLFRQLATLRTDAVDLHDVDDLRWAGPRPEFEPIAAALGLADVWSRARSLAEVSRSG